MVCKSLTFLALSSLAIARSHRHGHGRFHYGTGGSGFAHPTGGVNAPEGFNGSTEAGSSAAAESVPVMTLTVSPLPDTSTVDAQAAATSPVVAAVDASTTSCTTSDTSTTTLTSTEYVTVTVDEASSAASVTAASVTAAAAALESPTSTAELTSADSVSAGAFYGRPSGGAWSSPAAVIPTTLATMASSGAPAASVSWGSSAAPASSSTAGTGSAAGGKRGLSYNSASLLSAFSGKGMSWAYNWGAGPDGTIPSGMEFVPMCWGLNSVGAWASAAAAAIASGSTHVLSFNEPDLGTQSNMSPSVAATNHIQYLNPLSGKAQIGSPAITNGAGTSPLMGVDWLNQFFSSCGGKCKVDFVAFHWYDSANNIAYFKKHVQDVINAAAAAGVSKVWLTEFGASGSDADVAQFITEATSFLDSTPAVERYAYFMASSGILLNGNSLSTLGQAYTS